MASPGINARYNARLRSETFAAYGGQCACCGEAELAFLTLDHSEDDGAAHRLELLARERIFGRRFYAALRRLGFPQDAGLRILCYNCHNAIHTLGGCPHRMVDRPKELAA